MADSSQPKDQAKTSSFAAREGALALLSGVLKDKQMLSELVQGEDTIAGLVAADKARAQRLALETLRHLTNADKVIAAYVERTPPPDALNVLRLAVVELLVIGEAAHGVVDSSVSMMRRSRQSRRMAGLANAVLRRVSVEGGELWSQLPPPVLPKWLRRRIVHIFNEEIVQSIERAHLAGAPLDLTPKDPTQAKTLATELAAQQLSTGSLRLSQPGQVSALPGYETGQWWVQDAGAALAAKLLDPKPNETVLDLCAAPGGKTMQLAAAGAKVTALDVSERRLKRLSENLERVDLAADVVAADALNWTPPAPFDAILLDAPCSATGTIRRHPDLPFAKTGKELDSLFELQSNLIDKAVDWLKPGGRLIYCTCSLLTEEGERQAKTAIARHDLVELAPDIERLGIQRDWVHPQGGIRLRPDFWAECGGMDGFFMISLRKPD